MIWIPDWNERFKYVIICDIDIVLVFVHKIEIDLEHKWPRCLKLRKLLEILHENDYSQKLLFDSRNLCINAMRIHDYNQQAS